MVIVKKYLSLFLIYFLVLSFMMVGCSNDNLQRITDDNTSQAIFNYDFNYYHPEYLPDHVPTIGLPCNASCIMLHSFHSIQA